MPSDSVFAAIGAAPGFFVSVLSVLYILASAYVYFSLIHQIRSRPPNPVDPGHSSERAFGLPEAVVAAVLVLFLLLNISASFSQPSIDFSARNLLANFLLMALVVLFIVSFLQLRRFDVIALGGFFRISFIRTLGTAAEYCRVLQWIAHYRAANRDHRVRRSDRAGNRGVRIPIFHLWRNETLFGPFNRDHF